jgi:hypothetical protein
MCLLSIDALPSSNGLRYFATMSHPTQLDLERPQVLWATMLAQKRNELVAAKADKVLTITSMASVQSSLMVLHTKDKSSKTTKILSRIDPVLARLRCMVAAISVFIQADPTYSSLVRNTSISTKPDFPDHS